MKFFLKCTEASNLCDKSQYNEASFFAVIRLKAHLLLCSLCRKYHQRNGQLTNTINAAQLKSMSAEQKEMMRRRLQEEIGNTSDT